MGITFEWLRDHHSNAIVELQLTGATKHRSEHKVNPRNIAYLYGEVIKCN